MGLDDAGLAPGLIVHSVAPFNAEPELHRLRAAFVTPQRYFYVRSHGDIPRLNGSSQRLCVDGLVASPLDLSMADLRARFPARRVTAVMQCAGNRRADMQAVRHTSGDPWMAGAIGNAEWHGVALRDVLTAAGVRKGSGLHVAFTARDMVEMPGEGQFAFGVSIPLEKAMSDDVLLADEMNGEALTPAHGFPLRAVVPGFAGVRSAKWLSHVTVQDRPSDNHMQQRDYKLLPPHVSEADVDWRSGATINEMPLNAAICIPGPGECVTAGEVAVAGYAIATGRAVARVDVSGDGGATWLQAVLEHDAGSPWSWVFWRTALRLGGGTHELVVRAWDAAGQTQPERANAVWNFKGYLSAAWHRVEVHAV